MNQSLGRSEILKSVQVVQIKQTIFTETICMPLYCICVPVNCIYVPEKQILNT